MENSTQPRTRAIQRLTALLLRRGSPRLLMTLLLALTGLTGFLASVFLHAAGLSSMTFRYPLAAVTAYLMFLGLLLLLVLYYRHRRGRYPAEAAADAGTGGHSPMIDPFFKWSSTSATTTPSAAGSPAITPEKSSSGDGFSVGSVDGDGALVVVVVVLICIAVGSALCASAWVVIEAPILLAELLADGVLLIGLARRVNRGEASHWTSGVIRRTVTPFLIAIVGFGLVGFSLELLVPGASTMGDALRMASETRAER